MIKQVKAEIKKSIQYWKKHKMIALVSIFPPLLICLLFVGVFQTTGVVNLVVVNNDTEVSDDSWTDKFLEVMESQTGTIPYFTLVLTDEETAEDMFEMHETFAILFIPEGFGESIEEGSSLSLSVEFSAAHEDISKNVRLGIEARIYDFVKLYGLDSETRPGITISESLQNDSLARSSYMMAGIMIWTMVFFGLLIGGALGANEKEGGTLTYIKMAPKGELSSLMGKWAAAILISGVMLVILTLCYILFFGVSFPSVISVVYFVLIFLALTITFSLPGVLYGMRSGDFRLVPAPMIILSITLWLVSGALNPLEFSAGSAFFKYLPTASGIRIMSYALFSRGEQFVGESFVILFSWLAAALILFAVAIYIKQRKVGMPSISGQESK
jgi:ABC-type multidrug transport system permease subunit